METTKFFKNDDDIIQFLWWIGLLKSGLMPQGKSALQDNLGGYCCLGVAQALCAEDPLIYDNRLAGYLPNSSLGSPGWLSGIPANAHLKFGFDITLSNDEGMSHPDIADKLMKLYYDEVKHLM